MHKSGIQMDREKKPRPVNGMKKIWTLDPWPEDWTFLNLLALALPPNPGQA